MTAISQAEFPTRARARSSRGRVRAFLPLAPGAVLVALWLVWIGSSGAYYPTMWYPSALGCLSLFTITAGLRRRLLPPAGPARVALLAYAGLVAWNYVSILWAGSAGSALGAANEMLLYLLVGWTVAILPWRPRMLAGALGVWSLGIAAFGVVDLARAASTDHVVPFFVEYRWATPMGYPNATGALAMMGMLPALVLSSSRAVPRAWRIVLLAAAVFLAELALLPQSRAVLVGIIATAPIAILFAGDRWRLLGRLVVLGGCLALTIPRTIALNNALSDGHHVLPVFHRALTMILLTSLAALAAGLVLVVIESRWGRASAPPRRVPGRRSRAALAAVAVVVLAAGAVAAAPPVVHYVRVNTATENSPGSSRLLSISPEERFDYARVGLDLFRQAPILGVGAGNFGRRYDALRRFQKHSLYTHDLVLRVMSENGIVGLALFLVTLVALLWGLLRAAARRSDLTRACAVGVLALCAYFLLHDSLDWMDEFPVLAAPALALPLAVIVMRRPSRGEADGPLAPVPATPASSAIAGAPRRTVVRIGRLVRWPLAVVAVAGAAVLLTGPYLSTVYVNRALGVYPFRPAAAAADLRTARRLDPLTTAPLIARGTIDEALHEPVAAREAFVAADRQEPGWYPELEVAVLDAQMGDFTSARAQLARARSLDHNDPLLAQAADLVKRRVRIDPLHFNQLLTQGPQSNFFAPQQIK